MQYLLLSAQPSSSFTRLYARDLRTILLSHYIIINAILYYVICLMASVPTQASLPVKFYSSKSFRFPKRKFGMKTEKSFRAEWQEDNHYPWLHYDFGTNLAFCHLCMTAAHEGKLLASTKKTQPFLSKDLPTGRKQPSLSRSTLIRRPKTGRCFLELSMQNLRFLTRQGLVLRGTQGKEVYSS